MTLSKRQPTVPAEECLITPIDNTCLLAAIVILYIVAIKKSKYKALLKEIRYYRMVGPAHFYLFGLGVNESAWALAAVQAKGKNIYLNQADDHIEDILDVISIQ